MSDPYIGEIRMFAGNFAPTGWALCQGQLLAITQNEALFNLIGTTYGGNGTTTFALPTLQGRMPVHMGGSSVIGAPGGAESVSLTAATVPTHTHPAMGTTDHGDQAAPTGAVWAAGSGASNPYSATTPASQLNAGALSTFGGGQPHDNMSPFLAVNFIISLFGVFPSRT